MIRANNGRLLPGTEGNRFALCGFVFLKGTLTQYSSRSRSMERAQFYFSGCPQDLKLLENFLATSTLYWENVEGELHVALIFCQNLEMLLGRNFSISGLLLSRLLLLLGISYFNFNLKNKTNQSMFFLYRDVKIQLPF